MKVRSVVDYPDSLVDTTLRMLANVKLLNIFVTILLNKTNLYDSPSVLKTISIISLYFS